MPKPHTHVPKLADVARLAGVGNGTVSRALSGGKNVSSEKLQKIASAIRELGYQPNRVAQSLKGGSSGIIGMIVPSLSDLFFSKCAEAVERVVKEHGAILVLVASHDDDSIVLDSFRHLLQHHIDGLILAHSTWQNPDLAEALRTSRIPVVGIDRPLEHLGYPSLLCENYEGARMATQHLLDHGYRTVINVQVKPELYTMQERARGYAAAMEAAAMPRRQEVIRDRQDAIALLERHMHARDSKTPVAIFAGNNLTARYICEATHILALSIPRQCALLSFDDFDLADTLTPPMSVVQQPIEAMGRAAAKLLFAQAPDWKSRDQDAPTAPHLLAPRLVVRESCGCPRQGTALHESDLLVTAGSF